MRRADIERARMRVRSCCVGNDVVLHELDRLVAMALAAARREWRPVADAPMPDEAGSKFLVLTDDNDVASVERTEMYPEKLWAGAFRSYIAEDRVTHWSLL